MIWDLVHKYSVLFDPINILCITMWTWRIKMTQRIRFSLAVYHKNRGSN